MASFKLRSSSKSPNRLDRVVRDTWRKLSPSRVASASKTDKSDCSVPPILDFKGPLGLNLLHDPSDPQIDFIFVHGLGGGSQKTWASSADPRQYWPKTWLSEDAEFASVRIHSFGYNADWDEWRTSYLNILDFAQSLLGEMSCNTGIRRSNTKIVLIGHSMGGIVIKKAYMLAREDKNIEAEHFATRFHTLYFLATPHRGADFSEIFADILTISYGRKRFVAELSRNSESIRLINDSFRHFVGDLQLWSFYETNPTKIIGLQTVIVDVNSATLGFQNEHCRLLNADHRGVCKFQCKDDSNYVTLRDSFITSIDRISSENSTTSSRMRELEHEQLGRLLGICETPEDDLSTLEDTRVRGSCEWLINKPNYVSWQKARTGSRIFFWLTGNAGSGKSVLSSRVITELQQNNLRCSYFFFKKGNSQKSSLVTCLRSLANQMARADESILRKLLEMQQISSPWENWDDKTLWRKLFVGCIFKSFKPRTYFWVIDALDECQKSQSFLNLLTSAPLWLRVFFTSRNNRDNEKHTESMTGLVEYYEMQGEDTLGDFKIFIDTRLEHVPASNDKGRELLKEKILEKASGSFLWVSLVVKRLEESYSEEEAEEVLNEIPKDMNDLYAGMLANVLQNQRAIVLARSVYMWTLLSLRPLSIDGLQCALKKDTNQTVHNLEKLIPAISGRLVFINEKHQAEVIHETAKSYLLQQNTHPELAIYKPQCNNRIAHICLELLVGNFTMSLQSQTSNSSGVHSSSFTALDFTDYVCEYFSDHLQRTSSEDDGNWDLLCKFLDCNLLVWIEFLVKKRRLRSVIRTAQNLRAYYRRRVKYLSPISPQKASMEAWIYDMFRLCAKFGTSLTISPSSIRHLIPPMCPSESMISKYLRSFSTTRFTIKGLTDTSWDECLARIDYPTLQANGIACGERYSAVALSDGSVHLYFQDSVQVRSTLNHGGRANVLMFSNEDQFLASSGQRKVKVWDPDEGTLLWAFDTSHQTISLLFVENENTLAAATRGSYIVSWNLQDGKEVDRWQWTDSIRGTIDTKPSWPQPSKVAFSLNSSLLAVSYRGLPLHLFETTTQKCLGLFNRDCGPVFTGTSNHYIIEALAFNASPEINILIASYGDGELVVYNINSKQLRYRMRDVFAHCLKCSPDGRTLVTGSSRGTIQIFEFAGAGGERLLPLYKINAHDDGIRDIAFSSDSLRFADIRGSQYRVWEPTVLAYSDADEGSSQSDLSPAVSVEMRSVGMLEGPLNPEITAMCYHPSRGFVFCGKKDGTVCYFETSTAMQREVLYRHTSNIEITCILFVEKEHLLVTADESGRVLVNTIAYIDSGVVFLSCVAEIRSEQSLSSLLHNFDGSKILLRGNRSMEVWTTKGQKVGAAISDDDHEAVVANHPSDLGYFVSIGRQSLHIFSWADASCAEKLGDEHVAHVMVTPPTPTTYRVSLEKISTSCEEPWTPPFLAGLYKQNLMTPSHASNILIIWPASNLTTSSSLPPSIPLGNFSSDTRQVRQIIAITGCVLFFLDTDLWICSWDISTKSTILSGAKRHFFLLPEWQSVYGGFHIEYNPATREFVVSKKHELLVISQGLELEEPWTS